MQTTDHQCRQKGRDKMSILSVFGGGNPFRKSTLPKWKPTGETPTYRQFAGPHGAAFTAFKWARNIAIAEAFAVAVLASSTVYFANQQARVETAAVVLRDTGKIEDVVAAAGFSPDERVKGHQVLEYIERFRSVPTDRVRLKKDLMKVEAQSTSRALSAIAKRFQDDPWGPPYMIPENRNREVLGSNVFPPSDGSDTFNATWTERRWQDGRYTDVKMRGTVVLKRMSAKETERDIEAIKKNPTNLWVDGFKWEEER